MLFRTLRFVSPVAAAWILFTSGTWGQTSDPPAIEQDPTAEQTAQEQMFGEFTESLSPSVLVGSFTIDGKPLELQQERYEVSSVQKLPSGDLWLFKVRIRYGDHDVTVPLPLPVKWAGRTPVITVDSLTIPGLGTFNARVLISDGKYAGTWQHDDVTGHLFGQISKPDQPGEKKATADAPQPQP